MRVEIRSPLVRLSVDLTADQVIVLAREAIDMAADMDEEEADDGIIVEGFVPPEPEPPPQSETLTAEAEEVAPVVEEPTTPAVKPRKYSGFLHLRCAHCGEVKTFCAKVPIERYICGCGKKTLLGELHKIGFQCECGKWYEYRTNLADEIITMNCFACGSPVDLEWNRKCREYTKMR